MPAVGRLWPSVGNDDDGGDVGDDDGGYGGDGGDGGDVGDGGDGGGGGNLHDEAGCRLDEGFPNGSGRQEDKKTLNGNKNH